MSLESARRAEHDRYVRAYATGRYRIKPARLQDAVCDLRALPVRGAFLDVSCGYGDLIREARALGFAPCRGTEIIDHLCDGKTVVHAWAHNLPFAEKSFDVVSMLDTIEHLIAGDDEAACREIARVARRYIVITANDKPSCNHIGEDLHINKRPYAEWDVLFRKWFAPAAVMWLKEGRRDRGPFASSAWRVEL